VPDSLDQLVTTFYRAFSGEVDLVDDVVTSDWKDIPAHPGQAPGPDGIKPVIKSIGSSFSDFEIVVHDVIDGRGPDGNGKIGVRGEIRGVHTGATFGIAATGRHIRIALHEFHEVVNGRLATTWHLEDWFGFFKAVGQAPRISEEAK